MSQDPRERERRMYARNEVSTSLEILLQEGVLEGKARNVSKEGVLAVVSSGLRVKVRMDGKEVPGTLVLKETQRDSPRFAIASLTARRQPLVLQ